MPSARWVCVGENLFIGAPIVCGLRAWCAFLPRPALLPAGLLMLGFRFGRRGTGEPLSVLIASASPVSDPLPA